MTGTAPGDVLVRRSFEVPLGIEDAWRLLSDVERWPAWAPHIADVTIRPDGALGPESSGTFRFRPFGRSSFVMTRFEPPITWVWSGRALGTMIDYEHAFEAIAARSTRLVWTVRASGRAGVRARAFAAVYSRLIDRAWPRFVELASGR